MTEIILAGPYTSALTHFAGFGLTSILEEARCHGLRLRWSEDPEPRMSIRGPDDMAGSFGEVVRDHARRHAEVRSWVQQVATVQRGKKSVEVGLFSPRIAAPESAHAWEELYAKRRAALDDPINQSWLDARMLQALGEPAYWQFGTKNAQYDGGASRWEMKTRNRGEDFVRNRLAHLAQVVESREPDVIEKAFTDAAVDDSARKPDSRTGTGLVPPGPVDDAVAWCALWGISAFRLYPRLTGVAITPGAWPTDRVHPGLMALPMHTTLQTPAKLRRVLRSQDFSTSAFGDPEGRDGITVVGARERLVRQGIRGIVKFPIRKAGSSSAPERQVLSGTFEPF
nr:hypothetical protein ISGA_09565 [Gordonia sp. NB41Y]